MATPGSFPNNPTMSLEDRKTLNDHYLMPAEWEPHQGTILTWPHRPEIWRGQHEAVEVVFGIIAAELSKVEEVHINVPDQRWRAHAAEMVTHHSGGVAERLFWHEIPSDDVWARDHGPIFVTLQSTAHRNMHRRVMLDFEFNAWGDKFASARDNLVPRRMNDAVFRMPRLGPGLVMEGGSLEVNGWRDLLVTKSVLHNPNRNPGKTPEEIELILKQCLGVHRVHWLDQGLAGDDTDGHIDDIARFVAHDTIVVVSPQKGHADYEVMEVNKRLLAMMRGFQDRPFKVIELPVPDPVVFQGEHLPASYANFYLANGRVLMPWFNQPKHDLAARAIFEKHFPDRRVIMIDCRALVTQYGGIHCVTQQIPATPAE